MTHAVTPDGYAGPTQKVTVKDASSATVSWPAGNDGYDVLITASTSDAFRRRYAGRGG